jgi:uncharacterized repeat protein (TIGR02059 family)
MKYTFTAIFLLATAVLSGQTILTIEGKTYTNQDDTWYGVNIARSKPTTLTFRNNAITSVNRYGYLLSAGDEVPGAYNNNLDGAVITGNMLTWNGTPEPGIIPHGIFTGYNINVLVKYNYLNKVPMAIIRKSNGMTDVSGVVSYNIVKNPGVGVVVKGMNGVRIFNNTFYSSLTTAQTNRSFIDIYENPDVTPAGSAKGTKIYNNVFYTKSRLKNISITSACLSGFECDYNIYYCESGTPVFMVDGSLKTFSEWQAMGYDTHSRVINPNFKDLVSFVPAARLDYGTDLGQAFATGLSVDAKWGTTSPATATQNGRWQVGAVIYKEVAEPAPAPEYLGALIDNATPARLEMTFSLTLANILPATSSFSVTVNGTPGSVSTVSVSGTKVLLGLSSQVSYGDRITVAYTKPSTNPLQTAAGGQAESFSARNVTNNVAPPLPVLVSMVIENASPSAIVLTYNMSLASIVPAASAFAVKVNSTARTVSSVAVSGTKVTLTLANPVVYGDAVTIAYTKPSTNPLQTAAGGQAESFPAKTVTNNLTAPVNSPPLIDISSPTKSTAFIAPATVTIEASASDPDGKVIRVEFYNGTTKLGERTSEPWSFTWKEINEGSYSITAAATDNLGARTVSSAVRIVVEKAVSAVNLAPSIAIISPINNISLEAPATVTIAVDASDPDGSIAKVEFMVGGIKFGESSVYPFSFTFQCDTAGICEIIAVAWDNLNATTTSAPVTISFSLKRELPDLAVLYPSPNNGVFTVGFNPFTDSLSEKRLTILSLSGRTVFSNEISDEETSRQIDISGVVPGIYIMHITEGNRILTAKRFIIY